MALQTPAALLRFESGANDGASASSNTHAVDILWRVCSVSPLVEPPGCSCVVRPTDFIEPGWDTLCQSQVGHAVTSLLKNSAYLAWRYVGHPGEGVSSSNPYWRFAFWSAGSSDPLGCVVLRPGESGGGHAGRCHLAPTCAGIARWHAPGRRLSDGKGRAEARCDKFGSFREING
jgi:hypothetical protein